MAQGQAGGINSDEAKIYHQDAETALLPAPFWCTTRVESAHFDWRWRERPALALLAWEALVAIR